MTDSQIEPHAVSTSSSPMFWRAHGVRLLVQIYGREGADCVRNGRFGTLAVVAPLLGLAADVGQVFGRLALWLFFTSVAVLAAALLIALLGKRYREKCASVSIAALIFASGFGLYAGAQTFADYFLPNSEKSASENGVLAALGAPGVGALQNVLVPIENRLGDITSGVEQANETLAKFDQKLNELKVSQQERAQFRKQLFELNARHGALLNLVTGFVASITRENVPEDQIAATLFRMAAEWRTAGDRLDALGHSRALTPRLAELRLLASEARARGDVAAASAMLAKIDEEERIAEQNLQNQAATLQAEIAARRAGRVKTKETQIALALSGLRPKEAARFIVEKLDLEAQDPARRFAALRSLHEEYYDRGRDKGVNLDLEVAIELAQISVERASDSGQRGQGYNDLGNALQALGERESDPARLGQAVDAYREALKEYTRERVPLGWAMTQNNLGAALQALGERERDPARLGQAVDAFRGALKERTRERVPLDWAMTQNNLGNALSSLGKRESDPALLGQAVDAFREALKENTRERVPLNWAATQNNLGAALRLLGSRESDPARLGQAVDAYREALKEYTRERVPLDWAMTQNNLGAALQALGERESDPVRLRQAVDAYREALKEYTRERVPLDWAMTQNNLGNALRALGQRENDPALLGQAVEAYREALKERTRERVPLNWAATQNNLGAALRLLGSRESDPARLRQAVDTYRESLKENTRERAPYPWAQIRENMAIAFLAIYRLTGEKADRAQALEAVDDSLVVYRDAQSAYDIGTAEALRARILAAKPDTQ